MQSYHIEKKFFFIFIFFIFYFYAINCFASCTITTSQAVSFGSYNPFSLTESSTTGTINMSCSALLIGTYFYQVSLSQGSYGTFATRKMASGSNQINYNLYTDLAHTSIWGDGTSGTSTQSGTCIVIINSCSVNHTIYGRVPAQQNVAIGSYADSITVTVNY